MVALSDGHEETYDETDCSQVTLLGTDTFLDGREGKYNQDKLLRSNLTRYGCLFGWTRGVIQRKTGATNVSQSVELLCYMDKREIQRNKLLERNLTR